MNKLTSLLKKLNIPTSIHSKVEQLLMFFAANPHYLNIVMKQIGESKMNNNEKIRELIREEVRKQLQESKSDWMARGGSGTDIWLKNAHKFDNILGGEDKAEKIYYSIYEKLSVVADLIKRKIQLPTDIIVKFR